MYRVVTALMTGLLLGSALPEPAAAGDRLFTACRKADIRGHWLVLYERQNDYGLDTRFRCTMQVSRDGGIADSFCTNSQSDTKGAIWGWLSVDRKCRISGEVTVPFDSSERLAAGQMSQDRSIINGTFKWKSQSGFLVFSATRGRR